MTTPLHMVRPKRKVVFCIPVPKGGRPHPACIKSLEDSIPLVIEAGWDEGFTQSVGNPYISGARADMTRRALDSLAGRERFVEDSDVIVYIDYDMSWDARDLVTLIQTPGEVVAGTYRVKTEEVQYMGCISTNDLGKPIVRADGTLKATIMPAGFLKITTTAIDHFMTSYPELCFGPKYSQAVDLFNHGAHKGKWWGEDYAFSRNWTACGGELWCVPNINLNHNEGDRVYEGNFHEFLLRCPGGSNSEQPVRPTLECVMVNG